MVGIARFEIGPGNKKYAAVLTDGRRVDFGDRRYQHFRDTTPLRAYSHLDHNDPVRRQSYRKRHGGIRLKDGRRAVDVKNSPAWLSWRYLW